MQECPQGGPAARRRGDGGALRPALRHRAPPPRRARAAHHRPPLPRGAGAALRALLVSGASEGSSRPERISTGRPAFLALVGPTASGKTELALAVARVLPVEIVSVDSRQVYRGMDVGTAKPTPAERARVPHHGLDLVDPDRRYSAGRFARVARAWMRDIAARNRVPLLVGGTGFFLRALLVPIFAEPSMDRGRVEALRRWLARQPRGLLEAWVRRLDPARAAQAVQGGPQRLSRTLEVALLAGRPMSEWHRVAPPAGDGVEGVLVRLELPREELDRRIAERALRMVDEGLVAEVEGLLARGHGPEAPGMTGVGYREIVAHLRGERTLAEAVEEVAASTRRYARRQLTWFRNQLPPDAVVLDATLPLAQRVETVLDAWKARGGATPATNREREEVR
ncbi:MAG: tRNA (adenosine(37)-N6)-dimethylallyltransferase MiaA [Gemmatimonadetes bacterium]|nr:tRNA (adenosine(37)-N6)-dimethylallyltransferase MiaA [Gemmatimonadota bacterium]